MALSLDIPYAWTAIASLAFSATHSLLWNTLHMDMHGEGAGCWHEFASQVIKLLYCTDVESGYKDGMPCVPFLPLMNAWEPIKDYIRWVYDNHTTHHDVGGG